MSPPALGIAFSLTDHAHPNVLVMMSVKIYDDFIKISVEKALIKVLIPSDNPILLLGRILVKNPSMQSEKSVQQHINRSD